MIKRILLIIALVMVLSRVALADTAVTDQVPTDQPSIKIEYKFKPDEQLRYKISMTSNTKVQGSDSTQVPLNLSGVLCQKAKNVRPNGDAEIVTTYEALKIEMLGNPVTVNCANMPPITTTMSLCGQVKRVEGLEKLSNTAGVASQLASVCVFATMVALPTTAVKVGDKWSQDLVFAQVGSGKAQSQLSSADEKSATIKQSLSGDLSLASTPISSQLSLGSTGKVIVDGTSLFSTVDGHILKSEVKGSSEVPMGADPKTALTLATKFNVTLELLAPKPEHPAAPK